MRIGHIEVIDSKGHVLMVYPIKRSDTDMNDERDKRNQHLGYLYKQYKGKMIDDNYTLKMYNAKGDMIAIAGHGRSTGRSISIKV